MHASLTRTTRAFSLLVGLALTAGLSGCDEPAVGDPCEPEQIPSDGFKASETYLETSSVQCRTRTCMVYRLSGDPSKVIGESSCQDPSTEPCVDPAERDARVYCTCRCKAPPGVSTTTCECPDGFSCQEVLELGGDGIRGSYCVRSSTVVDEG